MMYIQAITPDELYHHGIKGQKWGIRRFQKKDGTLTRSGMKRYNYKDSDKYKKMSDEDKKKFDKQMRKGRMQSKIRSVAGNASLSKKQLNAIDYKVVELGQSRIKATKSEMRRNRAAIYGTAALMTGYKIAKYYANLNNAAAKDIGKQEGLNTVQGGFTFGAGAVKRGSDVLKRAVDYKTGRYKSASKAPRLTMR